ncbi:lipocalin family protein [Chitinophagaceae bacterium LB-8]|uniref:Lipocalin family protein n=1 Tax=Paraflavisolibacter caeni TaxID=2982496 RepID=A0A9X3B8D8_9BACT|nr:lipocalin family protein [Paraflavisolibacter caeni]MCU7549636.1 lipocalin family protein [Paraflavisolibacter caeni]
MKITLTLVIGISLLLGSCHGNSKNKAKIVNDSQPNVNADTNVVTDSNKARSFDEMLYGSWVEPNPINEKEVQGFRLNHDSLATSINMATLLYKKWWAKDKYLFLVAESKGNRQEIIDTAVYQVVHLDNNQLVLKDRNRLLTYQRK